VVVLTLSLVFTLLILIIGMNFTFSKVYEFEASNKYENIDVVITYDEYSSSRLINKRYLLDDYVEEIYYSLSFFNLDVLVEGDNPYYARLMSSLPNEFELLVDMDVNISTNEMIITESYAEEKGIEIGDLIIFSVFGHAFEYEVGEIFPDKGLFLGTTFYIDKATLFEEAYGLGTLTNFGNAVYIVTREGINIDTLISELAADEHFSIYHIFPTIDQEDIAEKAADLSSMLLALGLIVLIAVIMVLDSLFPIVNRELRQQMGVAGTLGADKRFVWHINIIQWLIYTLLAFVFAYILSLFIINYGITVYGFSGFIPIKASTLMLSLAFVMAFVLFRAFIGYKHEERLSVASQSYDKKYLRLKVRYRLIILSTIILGLELAFGFFPLGIKGLIISVSSLYLALNLSSLALVFFSKLLSGSKRKTVFSVFQTKYLISNKHIHQSLRVVLISLLALVLIFSVRTFMFGEIDNFYEVMDFDLAIVNINDYEDSLVTEMDGYDINESDPAIFYRNIVLRFSDDEIETSKFFVSMDYEHSTRYFNFIFDNTVFDQNQVSDEIPYLLLPINFQLIYGLEIGDVVYVDLNYKLENIQMTVGGFIDTNFDNIVFSNIVQVSAFTQTAKPNAIFMNTNDKETLFSDLVRDYSDDMYYIMDPIAYFANTVESVSAITDYFTYFTLFMIICFVIIIFNNTILVFYGLKTDLARIKVLGAGDGIFIRNLVKEYLLILSIIILIGIGEVSILSEHLKYVVLLTRFYKNISSTPLTIINGCAIVGLVLILSYIYYYLNIKKIKIIEEVKIY